MKPPVGLLRWSRIAAMALVLLVFVLPVSHCTRTDVQPNVIAYQWVLVEAFQIKPNSGSTREELMWFQVQQVALTFAAFCWPIVTTIVALRIRRKSIRVIRLAVEPFMLIGSVWWLGIVILFKKPAIGFYVAAAGFVLYSLVWLSECLLFRSLSRTYAANEQSSN